MVRFFSRSAAATALQAQQRGASTRQRLREQVRQQALEVAKKEEEARLATAADKLIKGHVNVASKFEDPTKRFEEKANVTQNMIESAARGFGSRTLLTLEVLASFAQNLVVLFSVRLPWPTDLVRWFSEMFGFLFLVPDLFGWMFDLIYTAYAFVVELIAMIRRLLPSLALPEAPALPTGEATFVPLAKWLAFSVVFYPLLIWLLVEVWRPSNRLVADSDRFADGELIRVRGWWKSAWLGSLVTVWLGCVGLGVGGYCSLQSSSWVVPGIAALTLLFYAAFESAVLPFVAHCAPPFTTRALDCFVVRGEAPTVDSCLNKVCCSWTCDADGLAIDYPSCYSACTDLLTHTLTCGGRVQRMYRALVSSLVQQMRRTAAVLPMRLAAAYALATVLDGGDATVWLVLATLVAPHATLGGVVLGGVASVSLVPAGDASAAAYAVFLLCTSFPTGALAVASVVLLLVYAARTCVLLCVRPKRGAPPGASPDASPRDMAAGGGAAGGRAAGEAADEADGAQAELGRQLFYYAVYAKSRVVLLMLTVLYLPVVQSLAVALVREDSQVGGATVCSRHAFPPRDGGGGSVPGCDGALGWLLDALVLLMLPGVAFGVPLFLARLAQAAAREVTRRAESTQTGSRVELRAQAIAHVPLRCLPVSLGGWQLPPRPHAIVVENRAVMSLIAPYELTFAWWKSWQLLEKLPVLAATLLISDPQTVAAACVVVYAAQLTALVAWRPCVQQEGPRTHIGHTSRSTDLRAPPRVPAQMRGTTSRSSSSTSTATRR